MCQQTHIQHKLFLSLDEFLILSHMTKKIIRYQVFRKESVFRQHCEYIRADSDIPCPKVQGNILLHYIYTPYLQCVQFPVSNAHRHRQYTQKDDLLLISYKPPASWSFVPVGFQCFPLCRSDLRTTWMHYLDLYLMHPTAICALGKKKWRFSPTRTRSIFSRDWFDTRG